MADAEHSKFSASAAVRWINCPGSMVLSEGKAERPSKYAAQGTAAHQLAAWCLTEGKDAVAYLGRVIEADGFVFTVSEDDGDMDVSAEHVQCYVDKVREYQGDGTLLVEQRVHYHETIGVDEGDGFGTSDALIVRGNLLIVDDLKFGRGEEVDVVENPQMLLYAAGCLNMLEGVGEADGIERVLMVIHQPRADRRPREWEISRAELVDRMAVINEAAQRVFDARADYPSADWHEKYTSAENPKACRWCKAKATCVTLRNVVTETVFETPPASPEEFEAASVFSEGHRKSTEKFETHDGPAWLAACLARVDIIEDWCKAIRAEAEAEMLAGKTVPGWKLVNGKKGPRQWKDAAEAEAQLKAMRLKVEEMYDLKVISPTSAEKLAKAKTIGPRQWPKLQALITQSEGKLHVAPLSDPREPVSIAPVADEFEVAGSDAVSTDDLA